MHTHTFSVYSFLFVPLSIFSPLRFGFNLLFPIENSPSGRPHCQRNQLRRRPEEKNRLKATPAHIMQSDYFFSLSLSLSPRLRPLFRPETCNLALSRVILLPFPLAYSSTGDRLVSTTGLLLAVPQRLVPSSIVGHPKLNQQNAPVISLRFVAVRWHFRGNSGGIFFWLALVPQLN